MGDNKANIHSFVLCLRIINQMPHIRANPERFRHTKTWIGRSEKGPLHLDSKNSHINNKNFGNDFREVEGFDQC